MSESVPEAHPHSHHSGLQAKLMTKIGPFPAVIWAAILVGLWLVYRRLHNSSVTAAPVADTSTASINPETGTVPFSSGASGGGSSTPATPMSNVDWSTMAANGLFSQFDPSSVEQALSDFLQGNTLTSAEQPIVNKALQLFGSPPEGVIGGFGSTASAPVTSGRIFVVADQADADLAMSAGIAPSQLRYAGSDPYANKPSAVNMGYEAPTGLAVVKPGESQGAYWLGLAGGLAPAGATKVQGATRDETATLLQKLLNNLGV